MPGVLVPDTPESQTNHELLRTLQTKAATPATPMSKHSPPDPIHEPAGFHQATHVYVRVDKPGSLGQKFQGPFLIVQRPSNSTVVIHVGLTKSGEDRLECHHWENCRIAHMRPGAPIGRRPDLGRPPNEKSNMAAEDAPPNSNFEQPTFSQLHESQVTQPRSQSVSTDFEIQPAEPAELGENILPSSHQALNELVPAVTGPPPARPFSRQNNNKPLPALPTDNNETSGPALPGPATPSPRGCGSHPQPNEPRPWRQPGTSTSPSGPAELADHDYASSSRPPPLTDHSYFMSVPLPDPASPVRPPPGFENYNYNTGRPKRQTTLPKRLQDYDLS